MGLLWNREGGVISRGWVLRDRDSERERGDMRAGMSVRRRKGWPG